MVDADVAPFVVLLRDVYGLYPSAKPLSEGQVAMFIRALRHHSLTAVRAGFDAHVRDPQRGRFPPMPADVIAQIDGLAEDDRRPGAEEAWALALAAGDQTRTVLWTREMAQAWETARPVMDLGDEVGARMAFREVYARLVAEARTQQMPVAWSVSLGFDPEERNRVVADAVASGRLPESELLALAAPAPRGQIPLLALEAGPANEAARAALQAVAERLRTAATAIPIDTTERDRLRDLKAETRRRAVAYAEANGLDLPAESEGEA